MNMYGADVFTASIEVPFATSAEKAYIDSFWADNKNSPWTFIHPGDGNTYTMFFTNRPKVTRVETHGDVRYSIVITGVGYQE